MFRSEKFVQALVTHIAPCLIAKRRVLPKVPIALYLSIVATLAAAESRTFYLTHLNAQTVPLELDRLVANNSEWTVRIAPHWETLRSELKLETALNAIRMTGSLEALDAFQQVLQLLDVPRPTVTLAYRHIRVNQIEDLLGPTLAPPIATPLLNAENLVLDAWVGAGDWDKRLEKLAANGQAEVLHEGSVSVLDGWWASVWLGDVEATKPEFCMHAQPVVMADGSIWLAIGHGVIERQDNSVLGLTAGPNDEPGRAICENCAPGLSDAVLLPEIKLTALVPKGQSLLISGIGWRAKGEPTVTLPEGEYLIVTPTMERLE